MKPRRPGRFPRHVRRGRTKAGRGFCAPEPAVRRAGSDDGSQNEIPIAAIAYDGLGRRIRKEIKNSGDWSAGYNAQGQPNTMPYHYYHNGERTIETRDGGWHGHAVLRDHAGMSHGHAETGVAMPPLEHVWGLTYVDELVQVGVNQDPQNASGGTYSENLCERFFWACQEANFNVLGLLNAARQTFMAFWTSGSSDASRGLAKMEWGKYSMPAFSDCSLNDNPGSGDAYDGDPIGQINAYLLWQPKDAVDEPQRWEMTAYLTPDAPADACTVSVTPRHCKTFKPKPDQAFAWTNTSVKEGKVIATGTVLTDKHGLITLRNMTVTKGANRLTLQQR